MFHREQTLAKRLSKNIGKIALNILDFQALFQACRRRKFWRHTEVEHNPSHRNPGRKEKI